MQGKAAPARPLGPLGGRLLIGAAAGRFRSKCGRPVTSTPAPAPTTAYQRRFLRQWSSLSCRLPRSAGQRGRCQRARHPRQRLVQPGQCRTLCGRHRLDRGRQDPRRFSAPAVAPRSAKISCTSCRSRNGHDGLALSICRRGRYRVVQNIGFGRVERSFAGAKIKLAPMLLSKIYNLRETGSNPSCLANEKIEIDGGLVATGCETKDMKHIL